jgi:serine/threonine protein kinase
MNTMATQDAIPLGETTMSGRYRLFARIGRGGMADVFLGVCPGALGLDKVVVIKRMRKQAALDPDFVAMFLDEARLAARFSHPNVIHTYEVCRDGDLYFLAMEYLEGQSVSVIRRAARERGAKIPVPVVGRIVADALRGLHYAHTLCDYNGHPLRIIHRDISPQNLFVTYDGTAKILDFGVAKSASNNAHTQAGVIKGKLSYMSPEQVRGVEVDHRADVFAMGVVLWEMLAQTRLFPGDPVAALQKILHEPIVAPSVLDASVPGDLCAVVMKALARDPGERYQTADEMRVALEQVLRTIAMEPTEYAVRDYLSQLFEAQQQEQRRRVEQCMAGAGRHEASSDSAIPALSGSIPAFALSSSGEVVLSSRASMAQTEARRAPRHPILLGAIGVALVAVVGLAALGGRLSSQTPVSARAAAVNSPSIVEPAQPEMRPEKDVPARTDSAPEPPLAKAPVSSSVSPSTSAGAPAVDPLAGPRRHPAMAVAPTVGYQGSSPAAVKGSPVALPPKPNPAPTQEHPAPARTFNPWD